MVYGNGLENRRALTGTVGSNPTLSAMNLYMKQKIIHPDLVSITISSLIAGLGSGFVVIFIPLLLLNRGLELWQVCGFYVLYAVSKLLINYPVTKLINRYGARVGLISGYSFMAGFMILLTIYLAGGQYWSLLLMPPLMALQDSFIWNSQHLHISRVMNESRKSRDIAMMSNLGRIMGIFSPLIGGGIAILLGPAWLAGFAAIIIMLAIIPVWHLDKIAGGHQVSDDLSYSLKHAPARDLVAEFAFSTHTAVGVMVWPIYLAVFVPYFGQIGIIASVATAISVIIVHFIAKRGDKGESFRLLIEGSAGSSAVHIGRILASSNPVTLTVISALYDIALSYQLNPWKSLYYTHARKRGINYIMSMEIAGDLALVFLWSFLGIVSYFYHSNIFFTFAFAFAAVVVWLCLLMSGDKKLQSESS